MTYFAQLERDRNSGRLSKSVAGVAGSGVRYQSSRKNPGSLEHIDAAGKITVGTFENGKFTAKPVLTESQNEAQT